MDNNPNVKDFTPEQRGEALEWIITNCPNVGTILANLTRLEQNYILDMYYRLQIVSFPLKPTEFIIGIEYKNSAAVMAGKEKVNLSFKNPKRKYDEFAKDMLIAQLSKLVV